MAGVRASLSRLWGRAGPSSRPPLPPPRASRVGLGASEIAGVGPGGEAVAVDGLAVAVDGVAPDGLGVDGLGPGPGPGGGGEGDLLLLAFLTSSCQGCREFWDGLGRVTPHPGSGPGLHGSPRIAIVTPGPELEDRRKVAEVAPGGVTVVMSAEAWSNYDVSKSPFAVVVRGGRIAGEAPLFCWDDLHGLLDRLDLVDRPECGGGGGVA